VTAKKLLLELIKRQKKSAYRSGNWNKLEPEIKKTEDGIIIYLRNECIGFSFEKNGCFEGIFNWRE